MPEPARLEVMYANIERFEPFKQNKKIWGKRVDENKQLTELIRQSGDIDPLLVCKSGKKLEILSGESRYHSAVTLEIPVLPYKQIEVTGFKDKLIHVITRNIGHACSPGKLVRAITRFLVLTEPKPPVDESYDPRVDEPVEFVEPDSSIWDRTTEIVERLSFVPEDKERWVSQITRLYKRAKSNQHTQRVIENAAKVADAAGLGGLEASNNKADEQRGVVKDKGLEEKAAPTNSTVPVDLTNNPAPNVALDTLDLLQPAIDDLIKENERLTKKCAQETEYGDSQGRMIGQIEDNLYDLCEMAYARPIIDCGDFTYAVPVESITALMKDLHLHYYDPNAGAVQELDGGF